MKTIIIYLNNINLQLEVNAKKGVWLEHNHIYQAYFFLFLVMIYYVVFADFVLFFETLKIK